VLSFGIVVQFSCEADSRIPEPARLAALRAVFHEGTRFVANSGVTYIPNASTYILTYTGLTDWTLSDVTGGTAVETINKRYEPMLLQIGEAISREVGRVELNALAENLLKAA